MFPLKEKRFAEVTAPCPFITGAASKFRASTKWRNVFPKTGAGSKKVPLVLHLASSATTASRAEKFVQSTNRPVVVLPSISVGQRENATSPSTGSPQGPNPRVSVSRNRGIAHHLPPLTPLTPLTPVPLYPCIPVSLTPPHVFLRGLCGLCVRNPRESVSRERGINHRLPLLTPESLLHPHRHQHRILHSMN